MRHKKKARPTPEGILAAVGAVRRNNLRALVGNGKRFSTRVELAQALQRDDSYLTQLIGPNPIRKITENTARKFEWLLGLPVGALDKAE